jgi:drug/metabolite transporter (DMT)-like permease
MVGAMACAALFSLAGQTCIIISVRSGDISAVAPFRYTIIPFAILSGIVVFDHVPDATTLLGTAVVVGAGLYTFYREQSLRRLANRPRP